MAKLTGSASERLRAHVLSSIGTKQKLLAECEASILAAAEVLTVCLGGGGKAMLCGNGGSAADCQHIAAEFVSVLNPRFQRPGLPVLALTTDTSLLTARANDFGFDDVFERQVQAFGRPGDVVMGISTSGNSENVLRALRFAREHEMTAIGLTGRPSGKLPALSDVTIAVPAEVTQFIQEAHIMIGHILCDLVEQSLTFD
jgi:phosphoheptose isomerase